MVATLEEFKNLPVPMQDTKLRNLPLDGVDNFILQALAVDDRDFWFLIIAIGARPMKDSLLFSNVGTGIMRRA